MKKSKVETTPKRRKPALTTEARESYMISLAMDAAEKQFQEGTASSQVITHFLKLATSKAELEVEKLRSENEMLKAKTDALRSEARMEELYANAIKAMSRYQGRSNSEDDYDDY